MMRILIGLTMAQTTLLAAIGLKVFSLDADIVAARDASLDALAETAQLRQRADLMQTGAPQRGVHIADASSPTSEDIRQIVREEVTGLPVQGFAAPPASPEPRVASETEINAVRQQIDTFIARGAIEPAEMTKIQMQIARLPQDARREMLSRLTIAMNDGDIDGRF